MALEKRTDVTSRMTIWQCNAVPDSPWEDADLVVAHEKVPELGLDVQCARLRNYEVVAVGVEVGGLWRHVFGAGVDGVCTPGFECCFAGLGEKMLACDKITAVWEAEFGPEVGVGCYICDGCRLWLESEVGGKFLEVACLGQGWRDAIQPDLLVLMSW